jgi:DNA-binding NarL/FixJ family response regulator
MTEHTYQEDLIQLLTPRQREVLVKMARGLSNREISQKLVISLSTAEGHTIAIFQKLGVRSRTEAALIAYRAGLLDEDEEEEENPMNPL